MVYIFGVFFVLFLLLKIVLFFFPFFLFVEHIQREMVCDALDGALLFLKCVFPLLHSGGRAARTLEC